MVTLSPHTEKVVGSIPTEDVVGTGCSVFDVIGAHILSGVDERAFLCEVCMLSPCPQKVPAWAPI